MSNEINGQKKLLHDVNFSANVGGVVQASVVDSPSVGKGGRGGDGQDGEKDGQGVKKQGESVAPTSKTDPASTDVVALRKSVKAPGRGGKYPMPESFKISERVRAWAIRAGYTQTLNQRFEDFCLKAEMHGYKYANWDAAFMTACRMDWARLGPPSVKKLVAL
jgi:hypothetical protein